ncbi:hypothetical protein P43SY_001135 [Pythium insidiosum]|uniref:Cilia- and flagella-associated protein 45 n=1 Tax=Pythium insidiosum TaxID=114742 RepID=A0AAD5M7A4_PYTIN|nr:hypothetical protein P43SY_001135 [Pythium insidiosum]
MGPEEREAIDARRRRLVGSALTTGAPWECVEATFPTRFRRFFGQPAFWDAFQTACQGAATGTPWHQARQLMLSFSLPQEINAVDELGETMLTLASTFGRAPVVSVLCQTKGDPKIANAKGWSSVHIAAAYGHLAVLDVFLKLGISVNEPEPRLGYTPLHLAAAVDHVHVLQRLHESGQADFLKAAKNGYTVLHIAAEYDAERCVQFLVTHYPDLKHRCDRILQENAAHKAAKASRPHVLQILTANGTRLDVENKEAGKDIAGVAKVLTPDDLERLKKETVILTDEELRKRKKEQEEALRASRHESQERKRHMMDKEIEVRARREKSAMEMELDAERRALLSAEDVLRHQHLVSIRKVNSLATQATGYMTCDALKTHQHARAEVESKYDRLHNQIMERERVTELEQRKEDEAKAHAKRIEARKMLEQQIAERQKKKIHEEEAKAIEAQKILKTYKQYEAEEQKKLEQQRERVKDMMAEVVKTNERIKVMKDDALRREKQEEMVVAAYIRKKAADEEAKLQEETRLRKAKELRVAKLRAQQEKAQDKRAAQDEFRAKKAWEETEMNARRKEKQEKEARERLMHTILEDRKRQEAFHEEQQAQLRKHDALMDRLAQQRLMEEDRERTVALEAAQERAREHGQRLTEQIRQNAERQQKAKLFEQNDAKFAKKKAMKESIVAEKYRQETLHRLQKQGVAEEYLRELKRMTINETNA